LNFILGVGLVYRLLESGYRPCILRRSASYLNNARFGAKHADDYH